MTTRYSLILAALILLLAPILLHAGEAGKMKREVWTSISGSSLNNLRESSKFYQVADVVETINGSVAPSNWGDSYGQRLRAYVITPESGDYTFWIAGDDHCELNLSTDASKFNKRRIASISGWTGSQQWDKFSSQKSSLITLVAGQKYFIEALQKDGGGADHLAIAWQSPSGVREIIPVSALESFTLDPDDADDDGLKDSFESLFGLSASDNGSVNPDNGLMGDPDHDGYLNIEEQQFGTNPNEHGGVPGFFSYDRWDTHVGISIANLKSMPSFYGTPDTSEIIAGAETPVNTGNKFGARLSGSITAPVSGDYVFWIAGDDNVELILSTDASKFNKRRIAWHHGWTSHREWEKFSTQKSVSITLAAGEKYYIEALVKEWGGGDHLSIAWQSPGGEREVIPSSVLESSSIDPLDRDNDGLEDSWELANSLDAADATGENGALGDPDGDFAPNWLEFAAGTAPQSADASVPGALVYEQWNGIPGRYVKDLKTASHFLDAPDVRHAVVTGVGPFQWDQNLGNRIRGYITAPTTGDYTFWAEGNKEVELWLSSDADKFNKELLVRTAHFTAPFNYDYDISQKSKSVHLVAGQKYYLECYHKIDNKSGNHFTFAWQAPGGGREELPSSVLSTFYRQANDLDDDDLLDDYEFANGLDPNDNGSINPANGAYGDLDGDGLSNLEEQKYGTASNKLDTDGDGVSDFDEIKLLETQALVGDVAPFQNVQTINGSAFSDSLGEWANAGNLTYHTTARGWVEYTLNLPSAGVYMLDLHFGPHRGGSLSDEYEMVFSINGEFCARVKKTVGNSTTGHAKILTPWLPAGANTVRVLVDNSLTYRSVGIHSLSVLSSQGEDENGNGTPDWVESRLASENGLESGITQSQVSPVRLEGRSRYLGLASISGVTLHPAAADHWYADLALDSTGQPLSKSIHFENDGLVIDRSLIWATTNLLTQENMTVNLGDSLRLTAFNGAGQTGSVDENVAITVGGSSITITADQPLVHTFQTPGDITLSVTHTLNGLQTSRSITVKVLPQIPQIESPVCVSGFWREWDVPTLPEGAILEIDERIEVREVIPMGESGTRYILKMEAPENLHANVRLGEGGPILSTITMRGMSVRDNEHTSVRYVQSYGDGTYMVEMPAIIVGLHVDTILRYDIFIGGVTFEDGSIQKNIILPDNCDSMGMTLVRFLKIGSSGSVCNRVSVWQNGKRIAWYY